MLLEISIHLPALLCIACRASPATGIYTDGMIHAPLCLSCSQQSTGAIFAAIMEPNHDVCAVVCKCVNCRMPSQPKPCLPSCNKS